MKNPIFHLGYRIWQKKFSSISIHFWHSYLWKRSDTIFFFPIQILQKFVSTIPIHLQYRSDIDIFIFNTNPIPIRKKNSKKYFFIPEVAKNRYTQYIYWYSFSACLNWSLPKVWYLYQIWEGIEVPIIKNCKF